MSLLKCVMFLAALALSEGGVGGSLALQVGGSLALQVGGVGGSLALQVGGTAGCPHVARYITSQVAPAYDKYKQFLKIEFVPWGKTKRVNGELECQFGARDCWANRLHRCALDLLQGDEDAMVRYMVCEFTDPRPAYNGSYHCAQRAGLRLVEVDNCMATAQGTALEAAAEAAAAEPIRAFNSIPYTVINGRVDAEVSRQATRRLASLLCFELADDPTTGVTSCKI